MAYNPSNEYMGELVTALLRQAHFYPDRLNPETVERAAQIVLGSGEPNMAAQTSLAYVAHKIKDRGIDAERHPFTSSLASQQ